MEEMGISKEDIFGVFFDAFSVSREDAFGKCRKRDFVDCRIGLSWYLHNHCGWHMVDIADLLVSSYTTISYYLRESYDALYSYSPQFKSKMDKAITMISSMMKKDE